MKNSNLIVVIALILLIINLGHCQTLPKNLPYGYTINSKVARVIDGDTFVLADSQHVRILGINTPEIARLGKPAQPYADSAATFTKSLIEGKQVKLTFDAKTYDIFGRLLAYVWLTNKKGQDSLFIQAELLKAGLARISYYPKGKRYYELFYNLRRTAMKNKRGIWLRE
jgi:micrococcal nuclease